MSVCPLYINVFGCVKETKDVRRVLIHVIYAKYNVKNLIPHFLDSGTTDSRQPTVKTFKFAGRGQRDTPVINRRGLMRLLFLLPGINARKFIAESAETQQTPVNVESVMDDVEMMDEPVETDDFRDRRNSNRNCDWWKWIRNQPRRRSSLLHGMGEKRSSEEGNCDPPCKPSGKRIDVWCY